MISSRLCSSFFVISAEVNLILELMKHFKKYVESVQLLQKHSSVVFTPPLEESAFEDRTTLSQALAKTSKVETPKFFPPELCVKLITSLIHLEAYDLAKVTSEFSFRITVSVH